MLPAQAQVRPSTTVVNRYADVLRTFNPSFSPSKADDMATHVLLLASYYNLDPRLLVAIVGVESSWHTSAVSPAGARGLGQLMPGTAEALSVQSFEAYENLDGTARYLRRLLNKYWKLKPSTRYSLAIAGYNAGPEAVRRFGGVPPYAQTKAYVRNVIGLWHRLQGSLPRYALVSKTAKRAAPQHAAKVVPVVSLAELEHLDPGYAAGSEIRGETDQQRARAMGQRERQALEAETIVETHEKKTVGAFFRRLIGKKPVPNP